MNYILYLFNYYNYYIIFKNLNLFPNFLILNIFMEKT